VVSVVAGSTAGDCPVVIRVAILGADGEGATAAGGAAAAHCGGAGAGCEGKGDAYPAEAGGRLVICPTDSCIAIVGIVLTGDLGELLPTCGCTIAPLGRGACQVVVGLGGDTTAVGGGAM